VEGRLKMADNVEMPRFKRKQYIIAKRFQLKYAGVILSLMFITAGCCAYIVYYTAMILLGEKLANVYPQGHLAAIMNLVNFRILVSMLVVSPIVVCLGIYLSHKIAGPLFRIERVLDDMSKGDLSERIRLRKGDEMVSLANSVNRLTDSLSLTIMGGKSRIENALKELNDLKELAAHLPPEKDGSYLVSALERLDSEINLASKELERYKV